MAILGFICLLLVGLVFVFLACGVLFAGLAFGGTVEAVVPAVIAAVVLYLAFHFAPFTITITGG